MDINIIAEKDPGYATWVYNRVDGEMLSKIVNAEQASDLYSEGWRLSPAEFTDDENLKNDPQFAAVVDDVSQKLNFLINIDVCDDKSALLEFANDFLKLEVHHATGVKKLKNLINKKAEELNLFEEK